MKKILVILFIIVSSFSVAQQFVYPLQTGNRWQFGYPPLGDYMQAPMRVLKDTLMPNGKSYYPILYSDSVFVEYQRQNMDSVFIYNANSNKEVLTFLFSAKGKDTINTTINGRDTTDIFLIDTTIYNMFGALRRIFIFGINLRHTVDAGRVITVADSLGVYRIADSWGYYCVLQGAIISGKKYGSITSVANNNKPYPNVLILHQNYPNPFNPKTIISFVLAKSTHTKLDVYNSLGQNIVTLWNGNLNTGEHAFVFDATNYTSGIYYYRIQQQNSFQIKKMVLQK